MHGRPIEPEEPDHYADLGISYHASAIEVKKAFHRLALEHHPDKKAAGGAVDAMEFCKAREAYEVLRDSQAKYVYDEDYPYIQEWQRKRSGLLEGKRELPQKLAAAKAEARDKHGRKRSGSNETERRRRVWAMCERERERRADMRHENEEHNMFSTTHPRIQCGRFYTCSGCVSQMDREYHERINAYVSPTAEEYAEYLQWRAAEAEKRSEAAAQKRRAEQEREARERMERDQECLKKEQDKTNRAKQATERKLATKARVEAERSSEAARRAREQQEKDAQMRMAKSHIKEQHEEFSKYLQDLKDRGQELGTEVVVVNIGWTKKKGIASCLFCEEQIKYYSFRCPDGGAVACNPCKNKLSRYVPPNMDDEPLADDDEETNDISEDGLEGDVKNEDSA